MAILKTLIWVVQMISALSIIILVLLQHGKGADAGATFGSGGGSGSLFGASGSSNFLSRTTAIFAAIFFISTFTLVFFSSSGRFGDGGVMAGLNGKTVASGVASSPVKSASSTVKTNEPARSDKNQIPN
ncbi:MAG: preprotein translocase subunit SecG [Burkholderiales bacterium]|jgi:preprotein translocase subunit SecG|nr:preprotein translocase subunit SecG [Burkholderiales bacterium]MCE3268096.1 preprotein translocase subunit SecG [Burkholderiales bacterium]